MSTRSNIILVTPDNRVHQLYHHCDGYLSGVGEDLHKHLVYSIGMNTLIKDLSVYDILVGELASNDDYRDEGVMNLDDHNGLHGDIEYTYVIKDNKLFYVYKYSLCDYVNTYKDLIDYVCKDKNKLALDKPINDDDDLEIGSSYYDKMKRQDDLESSYDQFNDHDNNETMDDF